MKIEVIIINLTGMILKMRYCILEQVGAGGEGHLYLARDMELGNYWAVKELPLEKSVKPDCCGFWNIHPFHGW